MEIDLNLCLRQNRVIRQRSRPIFPESPFSSFNFKKFASKTMQCLHCVFYSTCLEGQAIIFNWEIEVILERSYASLFQCLNFDRLYQTVAPPLNSHLYTATNDLPTEATWIQETAIRNLKLCKASGLNDILADFQRATNHQLTQSYCNIHDVMFTNGTNIQQVDGFASYPFNQI